MKHNNVVNLEHRNTTVGPRYDPTSCDDFTITVALLPITLEVRSAYIVEAKLKVLGATVKLIEPLAHVALRLAWDLRERDERQYTESWLKATDGELDHDPMDDYYGSYN